MLWHAQYQSKVDKLTSQLETLVSGRQEKGLRVQVVRRRGGSR